MSGNFTVLLDANVLYSKYLRDLLVRLALAGLFCAKWTQEILDEMVDSILATRPNLQRSQLERICELMNQHFRDCLVTGYEPLIDSLELPDAEDRHVVAAAIRCNAAILLTFNLRDFPEDALDPYHITAQHPDDFLIKPDRIGQCPRLRRDSRNARRIHQTSLDC